MSALDPDHFGLEETPPYASALLVELWAAPNGSMPELRFRLETMFSILQDSPVVRNLTVPGCRYRCPLAQFEEILKNVIPPSMSALRRECGLTCTSDSMDSTDMGGDAAYTLLGALLGALGVVAVVWATGFRRYPHLAGSQSHMFHNDQLWLDNDAEAASDDPEADA